MPANYDALRQAHRDALDQHIGQQNPQAGKDVGAAELGPTRPENHPSQSRTPAWPESQRMDQQQAAASRMATASNERLNAKDKLQEHIAGGSANSPQKSPEAERSQKPTEREAIEARQGLAAEHAAAIAAKRDGMER